MNEEQTPLETSLVALRERIGNNLKLEPLAIISEVHQYGLVNRGLEVLAGHVILGDRYYELCRFVRENQLPPKPTRKLLMQVGFHKVRVSEILRIANVPDDMWKPYAARSMSFLKVLEIARLDGASADEHIAKFIEVEAEVTQASPAGVGYEGAGEPGEGSDKPEVSEDDKKKNKASAGAKAILAAAEYFNWKEQVFRNGSEWEVVVRKCKKPKQPKA